MLCSLEIVSLEPLLMLIKAAADTLISDAIPSVYTAGIALSALDRHEQKSNLLLCSRSPRICSHSNHFSSRAESGEVVG